MIDKILITPIGAQPDLHSDPNAAFAVIEVRPETAMRDRDRPVMPLLPRGYCLDTDDGETWTVLRGHVHSAVVPYTDGEVHYWYMYEAVNGKRVLD